MRVYRVYYEEGGVKPLTELPNNELDLLVNDIWTPKPHSAGSPSWEDFKDQCRIIMLARSMGLI